MAPIINDSGYPREEQETVCVYDALLGQWVLSSSVRRHITKMMKQYPEAEVKEQYSNGTPVYVEVVLNEDLVSFRKPVSKERKEEMSKLAKERFGK